MDDGKETKQVLQQLASSVVVDDVKWRKILKEWVFPPDPSTNHDVAYELHHGGTAQWFFQGGMFDEWKSTGSFLWIHGKPGSGKTVLCSAIVQEIVSLSKAGLASMAYFYFDFRDLDKQHIRNLLPSLLVQLSAQSDPCRDILSRLYSEHDNGEKKPRVGKMTQCLTDMLTIPDQRPIYIILDALDECPNSYGIPSPREQVLALVKDLVNLCLPHLHICVTSRFEFDIRATLGPVARHRVSLHDEIGQKKDIVDYIISVVYSGSETMMKRWREEDKKMVVDGLSEKADGMFRWVFCQLETLRQCLPQCVRRTLNELPETLDETYERVMMEIKKTNQAHAYRLLQCLTVAVRPLSVAELAELLAFDFDVAKGGIPKLNPDWRWEEQAVLSTCSSLITVVPGHGPPVVQFSHFSVKEFLMSDRLATSTGDISRYHISLKEAHTVLAQACLGALLRDVNNGTDNAPLARYAAKHWVTHTQVENVASRIRDGMECLFDPDKPYFEAWVRLHDLDHISYSGNIPDPVPRARPLYYAALCGFHELVELFTLKYQQYASARGGHCGTALHSASSAGHLQVVQTLLRHGIGVNVRGGGDGTPLLFSSRSGHLDIVQCLLEHDADVGLRDYRDNTPLNWAANGGHFDIVRVLLEHDADVDSKDCNDRTPLHDAIWGDSPKGDCPRVVRLLLEHGANVNAWDTRHRTPLHLVSMGQSNLDVARILVEHGADIDAEGEKGRTPEALASLQGRDEIARWLSEFRSGSAQT
ncbi:hypothetical protein EDB83DRAFT_1575968 [Lactarius deliciosus]|nr:hypothetical protein EDB83DRAFT_1575968 [Lactarius deliciosus]